LSRRNRFRKTRTHEANVMMTYVLMVRVMVIALDLLSAWLRARIAQ